MRLAHYVHLVDTKFTKWSNFVREAWLIKEKWNKRSCLKPPMNADARRCSAPLIGVDRRPSAVSHPPRGEGPSLLLARQFFPFLENLCDPFRPSPPRRCHLPQLFAKRPRSPQNSQ